MKIKKILFTVLIFVLLFFALTIPSAAFGEPSITVSEDYSYVTYNNEKYVRVDPSYTSILNTAWIYDIEFEGSSQDAVSACDAYANDSAIELSVTYKDGGSWYYIYINEKCLNEYNSIFKNGCDTYKFGFDHLTTLNIGSEKLFGKKTVIKGYEFNYYQHIGDISSTCFDGDILISNGYLLTNAAGELFYYDYYRSVAVNNGSDPSLNEKVTVWQITDESTVLTVNTFISDGTIPDGDISFDEDFEEGDGLVFGLVVFVFVLGVVPLIAGIVSFVFSLKADKQYKILLRVISALCAATFVIAIVTMIICLAIALV